MRLALYQPDIPQNTGTILRLAACFDIAVDVIGPTGFDMTDRALKRAGLDYLGHVSITRHETFEQFAMRSHGRIVLLSSHAETAYCDFAFESGDTLLFGRESAGVPELVHQRADAQLRIPIRRELRSLNIAVSAGIVLGEALRQTHGFPA